MGKRGGTDYSRISQRIQEEKSYRDTLQKELKIGSKEHYISSLSDSFKKYQDGFTSIRDLDYVESSKIESYYDERLAAGKTILESMPKDIDGFFEKSGKVDYEVGAYFTNEGKMIFSKEGGRKELYTTYEESNWIHKNGGFDSKSMDVHNHPGGNIASPGDIYAHDGKYSKLVVNTKHSVFIYNIPLKLTKNTRSMQKLGDEYEKLFFYAQFDNNFYAKIYGKSESFFNNPRISKPVMATEEAESWSKGLGQAYRIIDDLKKLGVKLEVVDKSKYKMSDYVKGNIPKKDLGLPNPDKMSDYILTTIVKKYTPKSLSTSANKASTEATKKSSKSPKKPPAAKKKTTTKKTTKKTPTPKKTTKKTKDKTTTKKTLKTNTKANEDKMKVLWSKSMKGKITKAEDKILQSYITKNGYEWIG